MLVKTPKPVFAAPDFVLLNMFFFIFSPDILAILGRGWFCQNLENSILVIKEHLSEMIKVKQKRGRIKKRRKQR